MSASSNHHRAGHAGVNGAVIRVRARRVESALNIPVDVTARDVARLRRGGCVEENVVCEGRELERDHVAPVDREITGREHISRRRRNRVRCRWRRRWWWILRTAAVTAGAAARGCCYKRRDTENACEV